MNQNRQVENGLPDNPAGLTEDKTSSVESLKDANGEAMIEETVIGVIPMTIAARVNEPSAARERPRLQYAQRCHLGNVRNRNEDSVYVFQAESGGELPLVPFGLYVVADGMKGITNYEIYWPKKGHAYIPYPEEWLKNERDTNIVIESVDGLR